MRLVHLNLGKLNFQALAVQVHDVDFSYSGLVEDACSYRKTYWIGSIE